MGNDKRILIVDDFEPFRRLVISLLSPIPCWKIVAEASDGCCAIEKAKELHPEVVLLDIALPKMNGIEVARQIGKLLPEAKIVFVTQETAAEVVEEAINLGAWGYVIKRNAAHDLVPAMEAVLAGNRFFSRDLLPNCGLSKEC